MAASLGPRSLTNLSFEQEQDANSALTEVDKALRSGQIGIQCEAVVKFPRLFEKYPFPILINSAMLKIADVFRGGNNFIRLCILKVAQQSEKHLDKIFNVDEFTRRIFGVIHSNDPVARAITLRTLGSVASIISEKKSVHHSIILCLDSNNAVEVEAAIFAAEKFSAKSKLFGANVCTKIGAMISGLSTPPEMKLKLIPILQHMHHDTSTTGKAIELCETVLTSYPAVQFVTLTLHTMTSLTLQSLLNLQDHVTRLLGYLTTDPRKRVKALCLDDLKVLASRAVYLWTVPNLEEVAKFSVEESLAVLKVKALRVLNAVCGNAAMTLLPLLPDTTLLDVCREFCYHDRSDLATQAVQLLTHLAKFKSLPSDLESEAMGAIQTHLVLLASEENSNSLLHLRLVLKCAVAISHGSPDISSKMVDILTSLLAVADESKQLPLCECLAAMGSDCPTALESVSPSILASLTTAISNPAREVSQVHVHMCTLLFQAGCHKPLSGPINGQVMACISRAGHWLAYKVARQAMRYCQYQVAYDILKSLSLQVVTEHIHFWIQGLQHACAAENRLRQVKTDNSDLISCITDAIELYVRSHVALKAASTPSNPLEFASAYIHLRMRYLQAHNLLVMSCKSFSAKPPPAITMALATSSGQEGTRWRQVVSQLEKCRIEYIEVIETASTLYKSAFDADPASLLNINVIQQSCDCMESVLGTIITTILKGKSTIGENQFLPVKMESTASTNSLNATMNVMQEIFTALEALLPETSTPATISYKLMDVLAWSVASFIKVSPSYPRFFFQTLQNTLVKLAVSPQQNANQEPIALRADTHLSLRVEGVVQRGDNPARFRQVSSVTITVVTNLCSRSSVINPNVKNNESTSVRLTQTVQPHNDYFSTSFVVPFPILGIHTAKVEASVVDENGVTWNTGPRTSLNIKSFDDNLQRQQMRARQQLQQQQQQQQQQQASTSQQSHYAALAHS